MSTVVSPGTPVRRQGLRRVLRFGLLAANLSILFAQAHAADLLQAFRDAMENDASFASARATLQAGREKLPQGYAGLLPTITGSGNSNWNRGQMDYRAPSTSSGPRIFNANGWSVTLTQPVYRPQNWATYQQAEFQVAQAEAVFAQAAQDLITRVAQAYFDVLASQDSLALVGAQKTAIAEQLEQAKRNFEVGTATITDTHEAQARFDLSTAQEIAAQNDLEIKKRALQLIIGKFPETLTPLRNSLQLRPPQPAVMEQWVDSAQKSSFAVRIQDAAMAVAQREIERQRAGHLPTLDLVGTRSYLGTGGGTTSNSAYDYNNNLIALQLSVPLYSGGVVNSRIREAQANLDKARADLENSKRQAALSARQSFLGVTNGMAQVRALEQALLSSETALSSNRLGYEVGVRINIDVLNSQQQVFSTKRDLSKARYDTIVNGLKLKAAAGALSAADLEEVNALLGSN